MNLKQTLKGVSRSFYLSLRALPRTVRGPMSLAFLACKAADTITDTRLLPLEQRLAMLEQYRSLFKAPNPSFFADLKDHVATHTDNPHEQSLLIELKDLFMALDALPTSDRTLIAELVEELTQGMILDLTHFPGDSSNELCAFNTDAELDQYTYYVAGCVGVFWTRMLREHFRFTRSWDRKEMKALGEQFGKGLQMVNILRDLPRDLERGRCYLPASALHQRGLAPHHLLDPETLPHIRPYLLQLVERTRERLAAGRRYTAAHPAYALRLKWVVLLPMKLGFQTLKRLEASEQWLDPKHIIKVPRSRVYCSMVTSGLQAMSGS
jgi:farnesyl-diphosphate farnesyltransferase